MLRIVQNKNASGAKNYYSKADYYTEGQELVGRWGGKGAELLGLHGQVDKTGFDALCDNLHPQTGHRLTARHDSDRTVGYDFVFNAPKGVSLVYSLTQDERILSAFRDSVHATMAELEEEAKTRVRGKGRDEDRITGNLCWAEFVHFTARPVDGVPDPHLHAHCFTFNSTFDAEENRWKAAQFRDLKRDASYFEAAFHARFAEQLNGLGYAIERRWKDWDVASVPKEIVGRFSRRTKLIERMAEEKGINDPIAKSELGAKTRQSKSEEHSLSELREIWTERLTPAERNAIVQRATPAAATRNQSVEAESKAIDYAIENAFERNSVVDVKNLLRDALKRGIGQVSVDGVKRELASKDVIQGEYRGRRVATTRAVLEEERSLVRFARDGRGARNPLNAHWRIRDSQLNKDQQAAVEQLLSSNDNVQILRGRAGTGKTRLLSEGVAGIEAGGHQVFAFAPSAEASRGVLASEGFSSATTVAELLVNENLQKQTAGQVLLIDEAGLLGTRTLNQVFDLAKRNDCRVILSGDWKQHGSVERGAAMRLLVEEGGLRPVTLRQNQRQESMEYRAFVDQIADGELAKAIERAGQLGWIRELGDENRNAVIAHDYVASIREKESVLVVCPTHAEGERVGRAIRSELKANKLLGTEDKIVERLINLHLTLAERSDAHSYSAGDVVVFHQNAAGHRKGERVTIGDVPDADEDLLKHAKHFQVYHTTQMPVATQELIRITANGKTHDGHRLNNGATYRVTGFTDDGALRLDNGWEIKSDWGMIAPAYVTTSHSSQGRTVDRVLIAEPSQSFGAASAEQFYVSVSRGRKGVRIYTDDREQLSAAVHRSGQRTSAMQFVDGSADDAELRRLQQARNTILAAQRESQQTERQWEMIYERH